MLLELRIANHMRVQRAGPLAYREVYAPCKGKRLKAMQVLTTARGTFSDPSQNLITRS